jgi:hypothetical protein
MEIQDFRNSHFSGVKIFICFFHKVHNMNILLESHACLFRFFISWTKEWMVLLNVVLGVGEWEVL